MEHGKSGSWVESRLQIKGVSGAGQQKPKLEGSIMVVRRKWRMSSSYGMQVAPHPHATLVVCSVSWNKVTSTRPALQIKSIISVVMLNMLNGDLFVKKNIKPNKIIFHDIAVHLIFANAVCKKVKPNKIIFYDIAVHYDRDFHKIMTKYILRISCVWFILYVATEWVYSVAFKNHTKKNAYKNAQMFAGTVPEVVSTVLLRLVLSLVGE